MEKERWTETYRENERTGEEEETFAVDSSKEKNVFFKVRTLWPLITSIWGLIKREEEIGEENSIRAKGR